MTEDVSSTLPAKIDQIVSYVHRGHEYPPEEDYQNWVLSHNIRHEQEAGARMWLVYDSLVAALDACTSGLRYLGFIHWGMFPGADEHRLWLSGMKLPGEDGKKNLGVGNYITIFECHWQEYLEPIYHSREVTGLRIGDSHPGGSHEFLFERLSH